MDEGYGADPYPSSGVSCPPPPVGPRAALTPAPPKSGGIGRLGQLAAGEEVGGLFLAEVGLAGRLVEFAGVGERGRHVAVADAHVARAREPVVQRAAERESLHQAVRGAPEVAAEPRLEVGRSVVEGDQLAAGPDQAGRRLDVVVDLAHARGARGNRAGRRTGRDPADVVDGRSVPGVEEARGPAAQPAVALHPRPGRGHVEAGCFEGGADRGEVLRLPRLRQALVRLLERLARGRHLGHGLVAGHVDHSHGGVEDVQVGAERGEVLLRGRPDLPEVGPTAGTPLASLVDQQAADDRDEHHRHEHDRGGPEPVQLLLVERGPAAVGGERAARRKADHGQGEGGRRQQPGARRAGHGRSWSRREAAAPPARILRLPLCQEMTSTRPLPVWATASLLEPRAGYARRSRCRGRA